MLIKAQELAQGETKKGLNYWLKKTDANPAEKVKEVSAIYNQLDIRQLAETRMNRFVELALLSLDRLSVSSDKKAPLQSFAERLLVREN